jgi:hypothetical protein
LWLRSMRIIEKLAASGGLLQRCIASPMFES